MTHNEPLYLIPLLDVVHLGGIFCSRYVLSPPPWLCHPSSPAGCGNLPEEWGVSSVADITNITMTQPQTAITAYANLVEAIYNTTIG